MPALVDGSDYPKAGYPETGSPESGSTGPEAMPRTAGPGPDFGPLDYATLSPYLRRRLRSLAEALGDIAESRWGTAGRPNPEAASDLEARRQDPPLVRQEAPHRHCRSGQDPAALGPVRKARKPR